MSKTKPAVGSFTREQRLTDAAAFQQVFDHARASRDRYFTVLFCENGQTHPRLGLAISKRRIRRATGRNRVKRLVRESFRTDGQQLPAVDLVVMAGSGAADADNRTIFASLAAHWRRIAGQQSKDRVDRH